MPKKPSKLTKRDLDALTKEAKADAEFVAFASDAGQPGLYVAARRGRVRFLFRYSPPEGGGRRQLQIDDYGAITLEQARSIAQELRGQVARGIDPQDAREAEQRAATTVENAVQGYLDDLRERAETGARRGKRSGYASAKRRLEVHVLPKLGEARIRDVTAEQVRSLHRSMKDTPVEANRTLTAFSAVFGWADRAQLIPSGTNPTRYVERFAETGRRRAFTSDELAALGAALHDAEQSGSEHRSVILALRLLALTGFRRAEVIGHTMKNRRGDREGLRWNDVDLDAGTVTLPDTKTGAQVRTIGQPVVELLRDAQPEGADGEDPVCPGTIPGQPFYGIDKARGRLWDAAGLDGVDLHSLRHTFASIGAHVEEGRYVGMVGALLGHGHQSRAVTERYITSNPEALRPAADAIAGEIARLLNLGEAREDRGPESETSETSQR